MAQPTVFDLASAARIASAVRKVEIGDRSEAALRFRRVDPAPRRTFRVATFTGEWDINELQTVEWKYQTTTPNTASVLNLTMHLPLVGTATSFDCVVAREGTAWYLVTAQEHSVKRGTFTAPWNKGSTALVTLATGGDVVADNRHATVSGSGTRNCTVARDEMHWELIAAECD